MTHLPTAPDVSQLQSLLREHADAHDDTPRQGEAQQAVIAFLESLLAHADKVSLPLLEAVIDLSTPSPQGNMFHEAAERVARQLVANLASTRLPAQLLTDALASQSPLILAAVLAHPSVPPLSMRAEDWEIVARCPEDVRIAYAGVLMSHAIMQHDLGMVIHLTGGQEYPPSREDVHLAAFQAQTFQKSSHEDDESILTHLLAHAAMHADQVDTALYREILALAQPTNPAHHRQARKVAQQILELRTVKPLELTEEDYVHACTSGSDDLARLVLASTQSRGVMLGDVALQTAAAPALAGGSDAFLLDFLAAVNISPSPEALTRVTEEATAQNARGMEVALKTYLESQPELAARLPDKLLHELRPDMPSAGAVFSISAESHGHDRVELTR